MSSFTPDLRRRTLLAGGLAGFATLCGGAPAAAQSRSDNPPGFFWGNPVVTFEADGRRIRLVEDFTYTDSTNRTWTAPAGSIVDGASIPRAFWTYIGGPLSGQFRNASIIHDHYCWIRVEPHERVHAVFFEGLLASGVAMAMARMMFQAVSTFGPKWDMGLPMECRNPNTADASRCRALQGRRTGDVKQMEATEANLDAFLSRMEQEQGLADEVAALKRSLSN